MEVAQALAGMIIGGLILFFWNGLASNLPWGVGGTVAASKQTPGLGDAIRRQFPNESGMMLSTDGITAFVVARPAAYYSMRRYFALEFIAQLVVALFLSIILMVVRSAGAEAQLAVAGLGALAAGTAIIVPYWNWWGFSARYAAGAIVNLFIGWFVVAFILSRFILI